MNASMAFERDEFYRETFNAVSLGSGQRLEQRLFADFTGTDLAQARFNHANLTEHTSRGRSTTPLISGPTP